MTDEQNDLNWLNEFEELAEEVLGEQETPPCYQVHPLVSDWYEETFADEGLDLRSSVMQALACLVTEVMADMPENIFNILAENVDEEEVAVWLHEILQVGRAFERALNTGRLDDL
ncbi:MAG: hypothetical protein K8I82_09035 [Anaerolineae bacterium]|nr:hypothetical protein [Anaerolineae bacterium]